MILLQRFSCQIQQHRKPRFAQCIHKRVKRFFAHAQTKVSLALLAAIRAGSKCAERVGRVNKGNDKGKLFILFVPLFTLSLLSKIVCSMRLVNDILK